MNISPAFASILRSGRSDFNARFMAARHVHPDLDVAGFIEFLQTGVDELVRAAERVRPDRLPEVVMAAYDAALELVGQKLAGPGARFNSVERAWRNVLPRAAPLLAIAPNKIIAAVCNATHQLAATPGARPKQWIETMAGPAPQCADVETFLKMGQVAAWHAGLAHFRESALVVADSLPDGFVLRAIGAESGANWVDVRKQLLANPWFDPASDELGKLDFRVAARVGSFRGFGGLFGELPRVVPAGKHFLVNSHKDYWLLTADAFGATFHRASKDEFNQGLKSPPLPPGLRIENLRVTVYGRSLELPRTGNITSAAANGSTLALTTDLSHAIVLVALPDR